VTCRAMAVLLSSFLVVGQGSGLVFQAAAAAAVEGACRGAGPPVGTWKPTCVCYPRSLSCACLFHSCCYAVFAGVGSERIVSNRGRDCNRHLPICGNGIGIAPLLRHCKFLIPIGISLLLSFFVSMSHGTQSFRNADVGR
jgi:hypothetical protein